MSEPVIVQLDADEASVDFLKTHCREVWWTSSKLPANKQVGAIVKSEMVTPTGGTSAGYSVSKRIFASTHPAVRRVNDVFRRLDALRVEMTIVKSASASDSENRFMVEPGRRIIMIQDIPEFEERFAEIRDELEDAVEMVAQCLDNSIVIDGKPIPSIKTLDQQRLVKAFNEKDYPGPDEIRKGVYISKPQYGTLQAEMVLPPAVLERELKRVNHELGDTVALAAQRVGSDLIEAMETLARNLSQRTYLNVVSTGGGELLDELRSYGQIEVISTAVTRNDRSILPDHIRLEIAWKEEREPGSFVTVKKTLPLISMETYQNLLRPYEEASKRQLRAGSIDNLLESLSCLERVKTMLGEEGKNMESSVAKVKELIELCSGGKGTKQATIELKQSEPLAMQLKMALHEATIAVADSAEKAVNYRRRVIL